VPEVAPPLEGVPVLVEDAPPVESPLPSLPPSSSSGPQAATAAVPARMKSVVRVR
jgi:hypothetical protein